MSVVYEVTAVVEHDIAEGWERYMRERHIPDVLASGWFTRASFARATGGRYLIRYHLASRSDLDRYLNEAAPALRAVHDAFRHDFSTMQDIPRTKERPPAPSRTVD